MKSNPIIQGINFQLVHLLIEKEEEELKQKVINHKAFNLLLSKTKHLLEKLFTIKYSKGIFYLIH